MCKSAGYGRIGYLNEPLSIRSVVDKLKVHFNMKYLRLALANGKTMGTKANFLIYLTITLFNCYGL